jgi:hypothetical protein
MLLLALIATIMYGTVGQRNWSCVLVSERMSTATDPTGSRHFLHIDLVETVALSCYQGRCETLHLLELIKTMCTSRTCRFLARWESPQVNVTSTSQTCISNTFTSQTSTSRRFPHVRRLRFKTQSWSHCSRKTRHKRRTTQAFSSLSQLYVRSQVRYDEEYQQLPLHVDVQVCLRR